MFFTFTAPRQEHRTSGDWDALAFIIVPSLASLSVTLSKWLRQYRPFPLS
jgi:hypothetical protein